MTRSISAILSQALADASVIKALDPSIKDQKSMVESYEKRLTENNTLVSLHSLTDLAVYAGHIFESLDIEKTIIRVTSQSGPGGIFRKKKAVGAKLIGARFILNNQLTKTTGLRAIFLGDNGDLYLKSCKALASIEAGRSMAFNRMQGVEDLKGELGRLLLRWMDLSTWWSTVALKDTNNIEMTANDYDLVTTQLAELISRVKEEMLVENDKLRGIMAKRRLTV